ncbi:MAG: hypothetical protein ABFD86_17860 [Bryobacteraceae bacterium]
MSTDWKSRAEAAEARAQKAENHVKFVENCRGTAIVKVRLEAVERERDQLAKRNRELRQVVDTQVSQIEAACKQAEAAEAERDEWRTKALDVEKHPVVVALVEERDALRRRAERAEHISDECANQNAALRAALEKGVERLSRDPEDAEHVDTCPHCGDEALDYIDSEEWKFDSHGDMLCRECGGHRGLCGYSSGGRNEIVLILKAALALTAPAAVKEEDTCEK